MKKLLLLMCISVLSVTFSCKEANIGGFTSESVKKDIIKDLQGVVWINTGRGDFYDKIELIGSVFIGTKDGIETALPFEASNVNGLLTELPNPIVLEIKSNNLYEEIYISPDFNSPNFKNLTHAVSLSHKYPEKLFSDFSKAQN